MIRGWDPLCCDDNGVTTLHIAALCGHVSVVRLLVEDYHCDPGVTDKYGNVPLDVARQYNKESVISFLSTFQKSVSSKVPSIYFIMPLLLYICSSLLQMIYAVL